MQRAENVLEGGLGVVKSALVRFRSGLTGQSSSKMQSQTCGGVCDRWDISISTC